MLIWSGNVICNYLLQKYAIKDQLKQEISEFFYCCLFSFQRTDVLTRDRDNSKAPNLSQQILCCCLQSFSSKELFLRRPHQRREGEDTDFQHWCQLQSRKKDWNLQIQRDNRSLSASLRRSIL